MTIERALMMGAGNKSSYTFTVPGGTLWGTLEYVTSLTNSFSVSPSHSGGAFSTGVPAGLTGGNWSLAKMPSTWVDASSSWLWWAGNAGSWTRHGNFSIGFFMVCTSAASNYSAIVANWANNVEAWIMFGDYGNRFNLDPGGYNTFTLGRIYWVNIVGNGASNVTMYIDDVSASVGYAAYRSGGSGYLSLFNYYSIGNYRPVGIYVNNLKIYTGTSNKFGPI